MILLLFPSDEFLPCPASGHQAGDAMQFQLLRYYFCVCRWDAGQITPLRGIPAVETRITALLAGVPSQGRSGDSIDELELSY